MNVEAASVKSSEPIGSCSSLYSRSLMCGGSALTLDQGLSMFAALGSPGDQETLMTMADLFAIIKSLEHVERAWRSNAISDADYERVCTRLITQFRATRQLVADEVPSVISFVEEFRIAARAAVNRLQVGVPATVEHANGNESSGGDESRRNNFTAAAIRATEEFLTVQDALELGERSVDRLLPFLRDLLLYLSKIAKVFDARDGEAVQQRDKVIHWVRQLDGMRASAQITEEDKRQLAHDLQGLYDAFRRRVGELEM